MLTNLLYGFLLGMVLQLSVGPVFFAILHKSATQGFGEAFKMTMGVAVIDTLYIGLSFTGITIILQLAWMREAVLIMGAAVLIFFGLRYCFKAKAGKKYVNRPLENITFQGESFFYGIKITAVNPLTILFWSGTFGVMTASGRLASGLEQIIYAAGCVLATIIFLGLVSLLGQYLRKIFSNPKLAVALDYVVGCLLIISGLGMGLKVLT